MSATTETKRKESTNESAGFLGWIEKIGNKLPDPFWLFVILSGVVAVSSWLASRAGLSAVDPSSGEEIHVENLLTGENLSRMVSDAVENFITFPPLGVILAVMLGVAIAEKTGLLSALVRRMVVRVSPKMLTFMVALAGVTGSVASDAIYVIIIPLGAMAFYAVGRSPIVGAMVAFAASSAGFNSSLILNITDLLLAGISTSAAQLVDETYVVSPLANIFFVIPSAVVLSLIITAVTEFYVDRKAKQLIDDDHIDTSELAFDDEAKPDDADDASADASEGETGASSASASDSPDDSEGATQEDLSLSPLEKKGLLWSGIALIAFLAVYFALLFVPGSPFARPDEGFMQSPLIQAIAVPIALAFFLSGLVYGLIVGTVKSAADIPAFMAKGLESLLPMMVLFFAVAQFLAWFQWSNLGSWTAIRGAELLQSWDLPNVLLFAAFVLMVALLNLFITSGSAQWALMAPVVVPMMMYVGIAPEVTQMLFRIGDSPSNIITPMSPYFAVALTFLQKYYKKAGVGTLMSLALPYSIAMCVGWFLFFLIWYFLGIPLGPEAPMTYDV
ncbi:aminobenzoyl-glutamate transport protein [Corynebacterium appendicis CIP 107643]|uniref:Aminobenzoyl-glutamate transport protein n=1 Tax=Corynebacterium appendicis CIP 107643 TaxID=1161099 RepID=A0A1N7JMF0_9CORY|nr:AbgT family transporter [Corynebacterium appendicis]WJY61578.1 p-aminobenzoyl-glutamate transport protein [Corynebacterium appendicis CIP 107643]SIS50529.1 aminobenzoyl-glutamate transport protein [Corynebacterium appendicis CIP 107643]